MGISRGEVGHQVLLLRFSSLCTFIHESLRPQFASQKLLRNLSLAILLVRRSKFSLSLSLLLFLLFWDSPSLIFSLSPGIFPFPDSRSTISGLHMIKVCIRARISLTLLLSPLLSQLALTLSFEANSCIDYTNYRFLLQRIANCSDRESFVVKLTSTYVSRCMALHIL